MKECIGCGAQIDLNSEFCPLCGLKLPAQNPSFVFLPPSGADGSNGFGGSGQKQRNSWDDTPGEESKMFFSGGKYELDYQK